MTAPQIVGCLLLVPALLLAILFLRSELYFPREIVDDVCNVSHASISGDQIVERFSKALTIQTITRGTQDYDGEPRREFARFLAKSKPLLNAYFLFYCSIFLVALNRFSCHLLVACCHCRDSKQLLSAVQRQRQRCDT